MKIGELAKATAIPVVTVRFYEREGLLPAPARTSANYRVYGEAHVERLSFIRHCRSLDMTLDEIRVLLAFRDKPQDDCGAVNAMLDAHIGHVASRIRELKNLEKHLRELRAQCDRAEAGKDCGILSRLSHGAAVAPKAPAPPAGRHVAGHVGGSHAVGKARR